MQEINKEILLYLNSFTEFSFMENIVFIFADAPIFFLPVFLVSYWIYYRVKNLDYKKDKLLFLFYSVIIGIVISLTIQQFVDIDRPETALKNSAKLLLEHIPDASFPSDHATVSFAFLFGLFLAGFKKTGYIFLPFVIIMNLSRVIAGVHWPFDIIAGTIVGLIGALIAFKLLTKQKLVIKLNDFIIETVKKIKL